MDNEFKDTRWKQRFQNFEKAFKLLESTISIKAPSIAERAGMTQFFEITFELSWKLLKDYQEEAGFTVKSPRDTIKQAFQAGYIADGHGWIDALENRNLTAHTYNEEIAVDVEKRIRDTYYPMILDLYKDFKKKLETE